jgi:hypothetical protein
MSKVSPAQMMIAQLPEQTGITGSEMRDIRSPKRLKSLFLLVFMRQGQNSRATE